MGGSCLPGLLCVSSSQEELHGIREKSRELVGNFSIKYSNHSFCFFVTRIVIPVFPIVTTHG